MGKHSTPGPRAFGRFHSPSTDKPAEVVEPGTSVKVETDVAMEPVAAEPDVAEPGDLESSATESAAVEPAAVESAAAESVAVEPVAVEPSTAEPTETAPAAKPARRRPVLRQALFAIVTAALVAGTLAFANLSKSVKLDVDGKTQTVSTYAADVSGVLADSGVKASNKDLVSPAQSDTVKDGQTVTVTHARPLTLNIDGKKTVKWVAALTVNEALDQLGLNDHGVSASRSTRIPVGGESLSLTAPKPIMVTADGQTQTVLTTATTAAGAITQAGIPLSATDQLSVPRDTAVTAGLQVSITRVALSTITEQRGVPYATTQQADPNQYVGIQSVLTAGANGVAAVTVEVQSTNGVETSRTDLATEVLTPPVNAVVSVGAKEFPANVNALNWNALSMCESTNNPKAVNKTNGKYFGLYQFSVATWASVGGSGNPVDATPEEQLARAKMLYMRSGAGQWECGSHLSD